MSDEMFCPTCGTKNQVTYNGQQCDEMLKVCIICGEHYHPSYNRCPNCQSPSFQPKRARCDYKFHLSS